MDWVGYVGPVVLAVMSAGLGYLVGRRQEMDEAVREAYLELQRLRDAPKFVRFRPKVQPPPATIPNVPDEPGDHEWRGSIHHLKSLALFVRDDDFFGYACGIEAALDRFVGHAKSVTMPLDHRDKAQERLMEELNELVPKAERGLRGWEGLFGVAKSSWRRWRRKSIRQPFVSRN